MTLLKYYKWDKFSLLTTLHPGHVEFTSAVRRLVHEYTNEKGYVNMIYGILEVWSLFDSKKIEVADIYCNSPRCWCAESLSSCCSNIKWENGFICSWYNLRAHEETPFMCSHAAAAADFSISLQGAI